MKTRDRTQHPLPHAALSGDPTDFQKWVGKPAYIPPNLLDAYSWSLHKLRREEVMVQQGGDEAGYEADRRWRENTINTRQIKIADDKRTRGFQTAHHLFRRFRYRTCVAQVYITMEFQIRSSRILWGCLLSQRDDAMLGEEPGEAQERLATAPACPSPLSGTINPFHPCS